MSLISLRILAPQLIETAAKIVPYRISFVHKIPLGDFSVVMLTRFQTGLTIVLLLHHGM